MKIKRIKLINADASDVMFHDFWTKVAVCILLARTVLCKYGVLFPGTVILYFHSTAVRYLAYVLYHTVG